MRPGEPAADPAAAPLVSVVVPTYDRLPLLRQAVESVRAQTFADWELIVADDGSADGTAEWVRDLDDPRVRLLSLPHTANVAAVRNAGVAAARGEYVAFLDSDDVWEPEKLGTQVGMTRRQGFRWSYTGLESMDAAGAPVPFRAGEFRPLTGRILPELLTGRAAACICTLLVERSLLAEVGGFDEELGARDDLDLALRLAAAAPALAVPATLVRIREHPGRRTASLSEPHRRSFRVFAKVLRWERDPMLRRAARRRCAQILVESGHQEAAAGHRRAALESLLRALRFRPSPVPWLRALARLVVGPRKP